MSARIRSPIITLSTTPSSASASTPSPSSASGPLSPNTQEASCIVRVEERRSYLLHVPVSQLAEISENGAQLVDISSVPTITTTTTTTTDSFPPTPFSPVHRSKSVFTGGTHNTNAGFANQLTTSDTCTRSRSAQDIYIPTNPSPITTTTTTPPTTTTTMTHTHTHKTTRPQSLKPSSAPSAPASDWRHFSVSSPISATSAPGWLQSLLPINGGGGGGGNGVISYSGAGAGGAGGGGGWTKKPRRKILFYNKTDPYYGFTNFSTHQVYYKGKRYPTSEHLFQSFKFQEHRPYLAEHIRTCSERPSVAFSEARRFQPEVRRDWKKVNIQKMEETLYLKFTQHRSLKQELLDTGDAELVEDSDKDSFWGIGADRRGRNELGKALERLRARLRDEV